MQLGPGSQPGEAVIGLPCETHGVPVALLAARRGPRFLLQATAEKLVREAAAQGANIILLQARPQALAASSAQRLRCSGKPLGPMPCPLSPAAGAARRRTMQELFEAPYFCQVRSCAPPRTTRAYPAVLGARAAVSSLWAAQQFQHRRGGWF